MHPYFSDHHSRSMKMSSMNRLPASMLIRTLAFLSTVENRAVLLHLEQPFLIGGALLVQYLGEFSVTTLCHSLPCRAVEAD